MGGGGFGEHHLGVGPHELGDSGPDQRIVKGRLDPHLGEDAFGHAARRRIGAVQHQDMVAAFDKGQRRGDDGLQTRRDGLGPFAALDGGGRLFKGH